MLRKIPSCTILIVLFFRITQLSAQTNTTHLIQDMEWRNIGPANQGGRISDIEADLNDFTHVYIASASGGVWKSHNAGTTWTPIFDDYEVASIGDIALDPNDSETIWVGTGESNNRNSVSWGNGIYKSTDGGESFVNKGLASTHQIARVLVNPENSDDVCVCALGHLWGYTGDRGLYRSTDGGDTWNKSKNGLPDDGKTGCIDLVRDSKNPNILYTAFYHRLRQPWHFHSGGEQGGIYKSVDGGQSWKKLYQGLPAGPTGRIGLAIYEKNPNILMAIVEAEKTDTLGITGSGIYRSEDGGEHWTYVNTYNNRPFYYSQIRINPNDDQKVYVLTTSFRVSEDGGTTLRDGSEDQEVHGDFHAMWLDPKDKDRYYLGADKGLSLTHDHGQHFQLIDNLPIAQYYRIGFDMRDPYYVYGGLQDNGSYATASFARDARGILSDVNWKMHWGDGQDAVVNPTDWTDMYSSGENGGYYKYNPKTREIKRISPNPFNTTNAAQYAEGKNGDNEDNMRFNWSAPLVLSPQDPTHVYVGGNHLYKSTDRGETWKIISGDLSTNDPIKRVKGKSGGVTPDNTGAETHCAISSIAPSEISAKVIWVGTDDGNVQVTQDAGRSWKNVRSNISGVPDGIWVSRIEASKFVDGRAYVSFDGHRSDRFDTWIFVTEDYGVTWRQIVRGFDRGETVRVIREDVKNPDLLFAGTETGVWFSIDRGGEWARLKMNMPTVSVYDIKIHPRENDLIVGSHGRSAWILDDISPLQQWDNTIGQKSIHVFEQKEATLWENLSRGGQRGHFWFAGDNPKTIKNTSTVPRAEFVNLAAINYYVGGSGKDSLTMHISDPSGSMSTVIKLPKEKGIHRYYWDRTFDADDLSMEDVAQLDGILQSIVAQAGNSTVRGIYNRFKKAKSSDEIRKIIAPLSSGYLSFKFDDKFLIPVAKEGSYIVEMEDGNSMDKGILVIRADPMNEPEK